MNWRRGWVSSSSISALAVSLHPLSCVLRRRPDKSDWHSSSTAGVFIESSTEALRMINWCVAVCLGSIKAGACVSALPLSERLMQASVLQPNWQPHCSGRVTALTCGINLFNLSINQWAAVSPAERPEGQCPFDGLHWMLGAVKLNTLACCIQTGAQLLWNCGEETEAQMLGNRLQIKDILFFENSRFTVEAWQCPTKLLV